MSAAEQTLPSAPAVSDKPRRFWRRLPLAVGLGAAALALPLLAPVPARAWWVAPGPVYIAPAPRYYYGPPVAYYGPYAPPVRWVPAHYNWRGYWIPGHWAP
jgi:hypothetical protein